MVDGLGKYTLLKEKYHNHLWSILKRGPIGFTSCLVQLYVCTVIYYMKYMLKESENTNIQVLKFHINKSAVRKELKER